MNKNFLQRSYVKLLNDFDSYEFYLENIIINFDNKLWKETKTIDSKQAYENYILKYPSGIHISNCKKKHKKQLEKELSVEIASWLNQVLPNSCYEKSRNSLEDNIKSWYGMKLYHKGLTELPEFLRYFVDLEEIDVSYNHLTKLPKALKHLVNLKELDVSRNNLASLPESIDDFPINLAILNIQGNNLTSLPEYIGELPNLKDLNIMENNINTTTLPDPVGKFPNLTSLSVGNFGADKLLGKWVENFKNLTYLMIPIDIISDLPSSNSEFYRKITYLGIASLKADVLSQKLLFFKYIKSLHISCSSLTKIPENLEELKALEYLNITSDSLQKLPETIGYLSNLKELHIWCENLAELPETIGKLKKLGFLHISSSNLSKIPASIHELNLSEKKLQDLHDLVKSNDKSAFLLAQKIDTKYSYGEYLTRFPSGLHRFEATSRIDSLISKESTLE